MAAVKIMEVILERDNSAEKMYFDKALDQLRKRASKYDTRGSTTNLNNSRQVGYDNTPPLPPLPPTQSTPLIPSSEALSGLLMSLTKQPQQQQQQQQHLLQPISHSSSTNIGTSPIDSIAMLDSDSLLQLQAVINEQLQSKQQQQQPLRENLKRPRMEMESLNENVRVLHHELSPSIRDPRRGIIFF